jgi:hypothetical protein
MMTTSTNDEVVFTIDQHSTPYTHLDFKNDPYEFQFAILSDNAGGGRPGVLTAGLEMLNLLHPEFVVGLGDLIEGYTAPDGGSADEEAYREWWAEIDGNLERLEMPFFFLPGNHDLNNPPSVNVWRERHGGSREYYHFRYKDTLFLMVNTEDPPKDTDALVRDDPEQAKVLDDAYHAVKKAAAEGAPGEQLLELAEPIEEYFSTIQISDAQVEYFRQVLADNSDDVRWTFVMMHSPAWWSPTTAERDPGNFTEIEELLTDRDYTVVAAHTHTYNYTHRYGHDYITTSMTGALNVPRLGAIDHVVWVTMTRDGPKIANLLLNGILDKRGPVEGDITVEHGMYQPLPT